MRGRLGAEGSRPGLLASGRDWARDRVTPLRRIRAQNAWWSRRGFQEDSSLLVKNPTPLHSLPQPPKVDNVAQPKSPGGGGVREMHPPPPHPTPPPTPRDQELRMEGSEHPGREVPRRRGAIKGRARCRQGRTHHGESRRWVSRRVRVTGLSENCASCSAAPLLYAGGGPTRPDRPPGAGQPIGHAPKDRRPGGVGPGRVPSPWRAPVPHLSRVG